MIFIIFVIVLFKKIIVMKYICLFILLLSPTLYLISCKGKTAGNTTTDSLSQSSMDVEDREPFDADSAYNFVSKQVAFGARTPDSKAHQDCRKWITDKIKFYGYDVVVDEFEGNDYFGKKVKGYNLLTKINPDVKDRVLLLAHYDSRQVADSDSEPDNKNKPILAADDGASGVAVLMEIIRMTANYPHRYDSTGIDILFVDLEDGGHTDSEGKDDENWCLGSKHYAQMMKNSSEKPKYAILLDMVGAKDAKFCFEQYSKAYASRYQSGIWEMAKKLGYADYFLPKDGGAITDDHVPLITVAGIPAVDIINFDPERNGGFASHWHTQKDNMDVIDKNTLKSVGETVLTFIKKPL